MEKKNKVYLNHMEKRGDRSEFGSTQMAHGGSQGWTSPQNHGTYHKKFFDMQETLDRQRKDAQSNTNTEIAHKIHRNS